MNRALKLWTTTLALATVTLPLAASAFIFPGGTSSYYTKYSGPLDGEESRLLTLINTYRAQNGRGPLKLSLALTNAAKWMSADMAAHNYFGHYDSLHRDPLTRMADFGYRYTTLRGETIAAGYSSAQSTFDQWRTSPLHNSIMLDPNYKVIGIGRAYGADSTYHWYWTADFGAFIDATYVNPLSL